MAEEIIEQPGEEGGEKKFTQAELDAIIGKRLSDERKKYPTAEELTAYNNWKAAQQSETEKIAGIIAERDTAKNALTSVQAEITQLKNERYLLSKGIDADDIDYYAYKIGKNVSESKTFEQAADEFLKEKQPSNTVRVDTGADFGNGKGAKTPSGMMNDLIRSVRK